MNPIALQFANGNIFFVGLFMIVAVLFLRLWFKGRVLSLVLRTSYITGIIFVISSATPLSIWIYCLWFCFCMACGFIVFSDKFSFQRKSLAVLIILLYSGAICAVELPYHFSSTITISSNESVFVIGDSLSAGISTKERAWPDILGDISHLKVTNLAKPGATVETAINQSAGVNKSNSLVLVEIGGNDLLGHTDSKTFYAQLNTLIGVLHSKSNQVVMFELPLLPFYNGFGKAQRDLARRYNVILIPKHYLTDVFAMKDGTLDGLHLSQKGHDALANSIYDLFKTN